MTFPKQRKQVAENQSSLPIKPPFNEAGTIFEINAKFLHGFLCGAVAWWCWPSDPKWWGFYIYAVVLWAACAAFIIQGIRSYLKLRDAKKRWEEIEGLGSRPKNARLPSKSDLQHEGMN